MPVKGHALLKLTIALAQCQCGAVYRNQSLKGKANIDLMFENGRWWLGHCAKFV